MKKLKYKKIIVFAGLILLIFILNRIFGWSEYLEDAECLEYLERTVEENLAYAVLLYMCVTIIGSVVLALPGVSFAVLAGLLFGPILGTICCSAAATVGAAVAFLAGRYFLKDSIKPVAMKNHYLKKWLFDESGKNQLFILMITRLVPVFPFNLQNFAYGVTDIRFVTYFVGSFIFMLPGTAMYTVGTAGLADPDNRILYLGVAAGIAVVVFAAGIILKSRYLGADQEKNDEED